MEDYRARTPNALNAASVAEEEQEEMRSAFTVGSDCPELSGMVVTVGFPGEIAESVVSGWAARSWRT